MEDRALSIYVSYSSTALTIAWVVTLMIMVAGIVGNILTVVALLRKTERTRNMTSPFIIGLCLFDCLFCILVLPFNVLRFYSGTDFKVGVFCQLVPFVQYGNVGASLLFIVMITINRYIMIVHFPIYNSIYRPRNIAIMIIICVLFSYGMQIPTLLGVWGKYAYDERLLGCTIVSDTNGRSSKTTLFIMGFVVPCLIIICCYSRIFFIVRRSENKILAHKARDSMTSPKAEKLKKKEWRITKMVLLIFVCFIMCYLPITIMKVADRRVDYPLGHLMAYMLLYLSACVNPIIYASMNRRAFLKIFTCESKNCCGLKPISESNRAVPTI